MGKKGIVRCAHPNDTAITRKVHDELWKIYREYTTPRTMLKGRLKGRKVRRVKVIEGPYKYTEAERALLKGERHGSWVIIDLYAPFNTAVGYAKELTRKLIAAGKRKRVRVTATVEILREASPPRVS